MDRYLVRYFLAVVDHGNFSRAAAQCNVSQPTLSAGIAKLERTFDTSLFHRSNQRVELTEAGNRFLGHARRIEREYNIAHQAMSGVTQPDILRLGVLTSVPGRFLAEALAAASERDANIEIVPGSERDLAGRLSRGRLDVALTLVRGAESRFAQAPVLEEGYALVMSRHHHLADMGQFDAQALQNETMIVRRHCEALSDTSRFFVERGVRPHFAMRSTNDERVLQMVEAGLGVTVMPDCYVSEGIAAARLNGFGLRRTIGFHFAPDAEHMRTNPPTFLQALTAVLQAAT